MRSIVLLSVFLICSCEPIAQTKLPLIFRIQEKLTTRHVHKYLCHDTLLSTSGASIHLYFNNKPSKPYLLLLHGMGVDAKTNWYKQVAYLSKYYNLLMPDLIFFGRSQSKAGDYSVEFQVRQIHEALTSLGIPMKKINVMGFSYGGLVTALYNQFYPEEVDKLIIIDGPVKFFSVKMADSLASVAGVKSMTNIIIPQTLHDFDAMQRAVISKNFPATKNLKKQLIAVYFTPTLDARSRQMSYLSSNQAKYQAYDYNLSTTSTLLIWGKKDGVIPLSVGEKLHAAFPNTTTLLVFKKAKHDCHFRYSKKLNRGVVKFLSN